MSQPAVDRLVASFGFAFHNVFARTLPEPSDFAAAVGERSAHLRAPLAVLVPELRYRLRRDGLRPAHVAEAFALYCAALPAPPGAAALAAARWMVAGGIAELAAADERRDALALAAFARALHGDSVHLLAASDSAARALADSLAAPLAALGMRARCIERSMSTAARRETYAGVVVCGAHREIAQDYLREKFHARRDQSTFPGKPGGLPCALVDDADLVMLDDAQAPLVLSTDADQSRERLIYEQAIELARSLDSGADFTLGEEGVRLAAAAAQRLERLVAPLGGDWSARQRREQLICAALEALHRAERGVDYRVEGDRVLFPPPAGGAEPAPEDAELRRLIEVKEGCRLSARREVLARISLPRFLGRYRSLAGACADAAGVAGEFWAMYAIKTARAGERAEPVGPAPRVFVAAAARRAAVVDAVRAAAGAGRAVLVAMRTPAEAERLRADLRQAGAEAPIALFPVLDAASLPPLRKPASLVIGELPDAGRHLARVYRASGADSCEWLLSLEDEALGARPGRVLAGAARLAAGESGELPGGIARWAGALAQRAAERACRAVRAEMKARDRTLDDLLAFSGRGE
jgi:preprotein translocase subunit SecA